MLEELGYQVTAFTDSVEALQSFTNHPENNDLVITDMTMAPPIDLILNP